MGEYEMHTGMYALNKYVLYKACMVILFITVNWIPPDDLKCLCSLLTYDL